jgi:hypothetical protein
MRTALEALAPCLTILELTDRHIDRAAGIQGETAAAPLADSGAPNEALHMARHEPCARPIPRIPGRHVEDAGDALSVLLSRRKP